MLPMIHDIFTAMLVAETLPHMSVAQYLRHERTDNIRHELVDGYLYAMTGASDRHNESTGWR